MHDHRRTAACCRERDARGVVTLTLNRPQSFNALSEGDARGAAGRARRASPTTRRARVVVLAAAGKAFCAGHDLKEMRAAPSLAYYEALFAQCARVMLAIQRLPVPVIARVQGIATAAGCQLVAMCDLAVAAERRALRGQRRQPRPVLLDAERGAVAQPGAQGGLRDARHRRLHLAPTRRATRGWSTASPTPTRSMPRSSRWSRASSPSRASRSRWARQLFYRQLETGIEAAYDDAGQTMACNMMDDARARRRAGLHRQAQAGLGR